MTFTIKKTILNKKQQTKEEYKKYLSLKSCLGNLKSFIDVEDKNKRFEIAFETARAGLLDIKRGFNPTHIQYDIEYKHRLFPKPLVHSFKLPLEDDKKPKLLLNLKSAKEYFRTSVKNKRAELKLITPEVSYHRDANGNTHTINKVGKGIGVHTETGTFLTIVNFKNIKKIFENKRPLNDSYHVGIELEFFCDWDKNQIAKHMYTAGLTKYLFLKTDASIKPEKGKHAHELCILCEEKEYKEVVEKVWEVLKQSNAKVNNTCGTHVHLDIRKRDVDTVFANLVASQDVLYGMNPLSRQPGSDKGERYCKKQTNKKIDTNQDRYFGINAKSIPQHNTIEIRIHSGILDASKLNNWIKLLTTIANKKEEVKIAPKSIEGFVKKFDIDNDLETYIKQRTEQFKEGTLDIEEAA